MNATDIIQMVTSFQKTRVLLTAYELEIFTVLGEDKKTSIEIAQTIQTDPRATDRLMNALCALEFLQKEGNLFSNTPDSKRYLVKQSPEFIASLQHSAHLWDTWSTMTDAVRTGTSVFDNPVNERGEKWLNAFIAAMHYRAKDTAAPVVSLLDLSNVKTVLDVGGGSGAYAMAFARANEKIHSTVFDLPNVTPITNRYIEAAGLSGRVITVDGDYNSDPLGKDYDLIFLSAVIHSNSPAENTELLKKCVDALHPGGQVVIQDFIVDETRTKPPFAALFSMNMLVGTDAGDTFTESEVSEWMTSVGLSHIERIDTPVGTTLIIGKKG